MSSSCGQAGSSCSNATEVSTVLPGRLVLLRTKNKKQRQIELTEKQIDRLQRRIFAMRRELNSMVVLTENGSKNKEKKKQRRAFVQEKKNKRRQRRQQKTAALQIPEGVHIVIRREKHRRIVIAYRLRKPKPIEAVESLDTDNGEDMVLEYAATIFNPLRSSEQGYSSEENESLGSKNSRGSKNSGSSKISTENRYRRWENTKQPMFDKLKHVETVVNALKLDHSISLSIKSSLANDESMLIEKIRTAMFVFGCLYGSYYHRQQSIQ
jgi:hypothetical protein